MNELMYAGEAVFQGHGAGNNGNPAKHLPYE